INDAILAVRTDPDMAVRLGRRTLNPLLWRLAEPTTGEEERRQIILALGRLRCQEARHPLVQLIRDDRQPLEVRREAVRALGALGGRQACDILGGVLSRPEYHPLHMATAEALEVLQGGDAVKPLLDRLERFRRPKTVEDLEGEADVRDRVVRALGIQL